MVHDDLTLSPLHPVYHGPQNQPAVRLQLNRTRTGPAGGKGQLDNGHYFGQRYRSIGVGLMVAEQRNRVGLGTSGGQNSLGISIGKRKECCTQNVRSCLSINSDVWPVNPVQIFKCRIITTTI